MLAFVTLVAASVVVSAIPATDTMSYRGSWVKDFENLIAFGDR